MSSVLHTSYGYMKLSFLLDYYYCLFSVKLYFQYYFVPQFCVILIFKIYTAVLWLLIKVIIGIILLLLAIKIVAAANTRR